MRVRALLLAAAGIVSAEELLLVWSTTIATGAQMISARVNGSDIVTSACDSRLAVGDVPIEVMVNSDARGTMQVGDNQYDMGDDNCDTMWNAQFVQVECRVPWEDELHFSPLAKRAEDCFASEDELDVLPLTAAEGNMQEPDEWFEADEDDQDYEEPGESPAPASPTTTGLDERQVSCQLQRNKRLGNPPYPKKWRRYAQSTTRLECGASECSIGQGIAYSITHQAGFSLSGVGRAEWLSGGYSVSFTRTNEQVMTCTAQARQFVCLKHWRRFQQYDIKTWNSWTCKPGQHDVKFFSTRAPMTDGKHIHYYCAQGSAACKNGMGTPFWEDRGWGIVT